MSAHTSIKHELLVRCLDAWTPAVLHGNKRITYLDVSPGPESSLAALRVFREFEDLLERHTLTMLVPSPAGLPAIPTGLVVLPSDAPEVLRATKGPVFGWFDGAEVPSEMGAHRSNEVLAAGTSPPVVPDSLGLTCRVELVNGAGRAETLVYAGSSEKALEKFKDELWALDEYGGIRLREPLDEERTLLDISLSPQLGPLRRILLARIVHTGGSTVAELKSWAMHSTMFRTADTMKALQSLASTHAVARAPESGRLSADTVLSPL